MAQFFRSATPMEDWRSVKTTVENSGVESGKIYLIEDTPMIALEDADYGDEAVFIYHIEKACLSKEARSVFEVGDRVYWSGIDGDPVTPTWDSGFYWVGIATEPSAADSDYVEVDFKGDKATQGTMPT